MGALLIEATPGGLRQTGDDAEILQGWPGLVPWGVWRVAGVCFGFELNYLYRYGVQNCMAGV
jgi:hypothetical protein